MQQFRAVVITNAGNTYNGEWDMFRNPSEGRLTDKEMMQYAMKAASEMAGGMRGGGSITVYTSEGWRAFPATSIENLLIETKD